MTAADAPADVVVGVGNDVVNWAAVGSMAQLEHRRVGLGHARKTKTRDVCSVVMPPSHSQQGPRSGENVLRKREHKEADTQHKKRLRRGGEEKEEGNMPLCWLAPHIVHTENHAMLPVFGCVHLLKGENNM